MLVNCGAAFCGWQKQPSAPSVQECLEHALGKLLGATVEVIGAGRTDTGVNAIGYVACFDGPEGLAADDFRYKLNAILPRSVVVSQVAPARADFHARFDARRREYTYFLHRVKDPFMDGYSLLCGYPDLDFDAMNAAAALLVGTHDFSCFEKVGADNKTSACTVFEAFWQPYVPSHVVVCGGPGSNDTYWYFRISADRFLRNMVRAIVGTLIEVGRGKRTLDDFAELILSPEGVLPSNTPCSSRTTATPSAKSKGPGRVPQGEPGPPSEGALPPNTPCGSRTTDIACVAGSVPSSAGRSEDRQKPTRRSLAGESVPGHALFLSKVEY